MLDVARTRDRVLVSADTDFGTLMAQTGHLALRGHVPAIDGSSAHRSSRHPLADLPETTEALDPGQRFPLEEARIRIRRLPIVE